MSRRAGRQREHSHTGEDDRGENGQHLQLETLRRDRVGDQSVHGPESDGDVAVYCADLIPQRSRTEGGRTAHTWRAIERLKPRQTLEQARTEVTLLFRRKKRPEEVHPDVVERRGHAGE